MTRATRPVDDEDSGEPAAATAAPTAEAAAGAAPPPLAEAGNSRLEDNGATPPAARSSPPPAPPTGDGAEVAVEAERVTAPAEAPLPSRSRRAASDGDDAAQCLRSSKIEGEGGCFGHAAGPPVAALGDIPPAAAGSGTAVVTSANNPMR